MISIDKLTTWSVQIILSIIISIFITCFYHNNTKLPKIVKADLTLITKNYVSRELIKVSPEESKQDYLIFMQLASKTIEQLAKEKDWIILLHESTLGGVTDVTKLVEQTIINNFSK